MAGLPGLPGNNCLRTGHRTGDLLPPRSTTPAIFMDRYRRHESACGRLHRWEGCGCVIRAGAGGRHAIPDPKQACSSTGSAVHRPPLKAGSAWLPDGRLNAQWPVP